MDYYKLLKSVDDYEKICICINDKIYTYNDVINDSIKLEEIFILKELVEKFKRENS